MTDVDRPATQHLANDMVLGVIAGGFITIGAFLVVLPLRYALRTPPS